MPAHPDDNAPELETLSASLPAQGISSPEKEPPASNKRLSDLYDAWIDKHVRIKDPPDPKKGKPAGPHHSKTGRVFGVDPCPMRFANAPHVKEGEWLCIRLDDFDPLNDHVPHVNYEPHNVEVID